MFKFFIYKDEAGEYRWRLRAANNKIIADSGEGYVDKSKCRGAVEIMRSETWAAQVVEME